MYVSSLGFPERNVLNYVYEELSKEATVSEARALSSEEFVQSFPGYEWAAVDVDPNEDVEVYRLRARQRVQADLSVDEGHRSR